MPQYQTWEEFSRAAEKLYLADPMKYWHSMAHNLLELPPVGRDTEAELYWKRFK